MNEPPKMEEYERIVREAELKSAEARIYSNQEGIAQQNEKSMIEQQLDLGEELDRIDYLLRGYTIERNSKTQKGEWVKPNDDAMVILTDYGVHLIRNTIAWYLNKNTLLSNYDDKTINTKMEDFASDLNDTIFMEYEKVFKYPSFEECKLILNKRIENKKKIRMYALEIMDNNVSIEKEIEIKNHILKEIEPIVEKELEKIKQQVIKNKLKRFLLIMRQIQDAIHSTYLRAWKGQERTTLRQHIHITESKGGFMNTPKQSPLDALKFR